VQKPLLEVGVLADACEVIAHGHGEHWVPRAATFPPQKWTLVHTIQ
jgi:hypothetical protein